MHRHDALQEQIYTRHGLNGHQSEDYCDGKQPVPEMYMEKYNHHRFHYKFKFCWPNSF